ncbi:MAG: phosphatase, partial [Oscillospiraceae bacterium]
MIYAVIDVGSNTMRLSVYLCEGKSVKTLFSNKETVGLAGYIKDGAMSDAGINKACYTLDLFISTL